MRVLLIATATLLLALPARADFAAGMKAYEAKDYATAYAEWLPLAEAGDARAQYGMGRLYRFGRGVEQDFETAIEWYKQAAMQTEDGDTYRRAVYALGYMVDEGQGTPKDADKAECLYRVSAENGYASAQWVYSNLLAAKPGIHPDALGWEERAAAQGDDLALRHLGYIRSMNPFVELSEAYKLTILAAERGNERAKWELTDIRDYARDKPETKKAIREAEEKAKVWRAVVEPPPADLILVPGRCWP